MPAASSPQRRERPGWWHTIGDLALAWIATAGCLLVVALLLAPLKLAPSRLPGDGPWRPHGLWEIVAGAWPALLAALLFGASLRSVAARRGGWRVRLAPIVPLAALCLLFGDGSSAADDSRRAVGLWAIVAIVVVARQFAYVRAVRPLRMPRPLVAAIAVVAVAATVAALAYRPLHPLHVQVGATPVGNGVHYGFADDEARDPRAVDFGIDNIGIGDVRIRSLRAQDASGASLGDVVAQFAAEDFTPATLDGWTALPPGGVALPRDGHESLHGRLRLAPGSCAGGNRARLEVDAVAVELETLGLRRTQRVALPAPVTLSCDR